MGAAAGEVGALGEAVVFLDYFKDLPDPRQRGKVIYPLDEVLLLCLLAVLGGAETFVDIARFGEKKIAVLRRFRPFRDGTPSHDHLGDIFATFDAAQFQRCFVAWVAARTGAPADVIAIDGKTLRRSYQKKGAKAPIHMVSAFAARQRLVLGQVKVADKSNEIVAIPALLAMMAIEGAIVTIVAMGCQREIAQQILDQKADYVLALKGNHGTLREDVDLFAAEQKANGFKNTKISRHETYTAIHDVAWLQERHDWPGLRGVVMVESTREFADKVERETRFYITSNAQQPEASRHFDVGCRASMLDAAQIGLMNTRPMCKFFLRQTPVAPQPLHIDRHPPVQPDAPRLASPRTFCAIVDLSRR